MKKKKILTHIFSRFSSKIFYCVVLYRCGEKSVARTDCMAPLSSLSFIASTTIHQLPHNHISTTSYTHTHTHMHEHMRATFRKCFANDMRINTQQCRINGELCIVRFFGVIHYSQYTIKFIIK